MLEYARGLGLHYSAALVEFLLSNLSLCRRTQELRVVPDLCYGLFLHYLTRKVGHPQISREMDGRWPVKGREVCIVLVLG